jgi:hypothetical protein
MERGFLARSRDLACIMEISFRCPCALIPRGKSSRLGWPVHAKDCHVQDHKPEWGPLRTRAIDWKGQIAALLQDGYRGHISLETHWPGPGGNKLEASRICGWNLRGLASL